MVHEDVLRKIPDADLRVYAVWEPILDSDTEQAARRAPVLLPDPRLTHFWVANRDVGALFQKAIDLHSSVAWDVYLVYQPGARWQDRVPRPDYFQHQLGGRLPAELRLDGPKLAARIEALLSAKR